MSTKTNCENGWSRSLKKACLLVFFGLVLLTEPRHGTPVWVRSEEVNLIRPASQCTGLSEIQVHDRMICVKESVDEVVRRLKLDAKD